MLRLWLLLACSGLSFAATWVVPQVTNRSLASGAHASSTLRLRNQGAEPAALRFELLPSAADPADPVTQTLDPGATLIIPNPLRTLWGREESTAALKITADQALALTAEANVDLPDGTVSRFAALVTRYESTLSGESTADLLNFPLPETSSATLGLVFLAPGSADVVSYNAGGAELARKTVSSDTASLVEFGAAELSAPDSETFRFEIEINSGRLTAYLQSLDATLNQFTLVSATPDPTGGPRLAYSLPTGARLALRLFNPDEDYTSSIQATLYPLTGGEPLASAKIAVPASAAAAIEDVVAESLGLESGTPGILQLAASYPAVIQARLINPDGHVTVPSGASPAADPAQVIALEPTSSLGLTAGPDGASVTLTLLDATGASLATTDLTLDPNTNSEFAPAALLNLDAMPENAAIQVDVTQGAAASYAVTGSVVQPAQVFAEYTCDQPYIDQFSSSATYPAAAGSYDLSWSVFNADSVSISGLGDVAATGTTSVDLEDSATYELTATGVCGTASQTLSIPIGAPRLTAVEPAEAKPGQLVRLTLENLADPQAVTGAELTFPNGTTAVVQVNVEDGAPVLTVPLPNNVGGVEGDYTGAVTIAARLDDDTRTNSLDFHFLKATYEGDAVADFRQWIDTKAARVRDVLTQLHDQEDLAPAIDTLLAGIDPDLAVLHQMADDIAASGSAVLPAEPATVDNPDPQPVVVTRADLEALMALFHEIDPPDTVPESPEAWKRRARAAGEGGPCLSDDSLYNTCYSIAQIDSNSLIARAWRAVGGVVDEIGKLVDKFAKDPRVILFNRIRHLAQKAEFFCNLYPVYLDSFNARPFPDPVPVGGFREVRNDGTRVFALLKSRWTREQAVDQIVQAARGFLIDSVINADKKTSKEGKDAAKDLANKWLNWLYQRSRDEVQAVADRYHLTTFREVQVYKCDLRSVLPQGLARNPLLGRDAAIEAELQTKGQYAYGFYGKQDGGLTYAQITTFPNHFVELTPNVNAAQKRGVKGGVYGVPIEVGRGVSSLKVTLTRVEERGGTYRTLVETYREFKVTPETRFDYSFGTAKSAMSMHVVKSGSSYKIDLSIAGSDPVDVQPQAGLQLTAKLRRQRGNRQQLRFRGQATGTSDRGYAGASMYFTNDGSAPNTSAKITYAFPPNPLSLGWNFTSTGARNAFFSIGLLGGGRSSSGTFSGTLTLPVP